jgi:hypothetical protein
MTNRRHKRGGRVTHGRDYRSIAELKEHARFRHSVRIYGDVGAEVHTRQTDGTPRDGFMLTDETGEIPVWFAPGRHEPQLLKMAGATVGARVSRCPCCGEPSLSLVEFWVALCPDHGREFEEHRHDD